MKCTHLPRRDMMTLVAISISASICAADADWPMPPFSLTFRERETTRHAAMVSASFASPRTMPSPPPHAHAISTQPQAPPASTCGDEKHFSASALLAIAMGDIGREARAPVISRNSRARRKRGHRQDGRLSAPRSRHRHAQPRCAAFSMLARRDIMTFTIFSAYAGA